jgi:hypothetical protein
MTLNSTYILSCVIICHEIFYPYTYSCVHPVGSSACAGLPRAPSGPASRAGGRARRVFFDVEAPAQSADGSCPWPGNSAASICSCWAAAQPLLASRQHFPDESATASTTRRLELPKTRRRLPNQQPRAPSRPSDLPIPSSSRTSPPPRRRRDPERVRSSRCCCRPTPDAPYPPPWKGPYELDAAASTWTRCRRTGRTSSTPPPDAPASTAVRRRTHHTHRRLDAVNPNAPPRTLLGLLLPPVNVHV